MQLIQRATHYIIAMMPQGLPNFQYCVVYSDTENAFYDEIFNAKKSREGEWMDSAVGVASFRLLELCLRELG